LFYYVCYALLTIALIPDMSGGWVQLMNLLGVKIQNDQLSFQVTDLDIGSVMGTALFNICLNTLASMFIHKETLWMVKMSV